MVLCSAAPAALAAPEPLALDPSFGENGVVAGGMSVPDYRHAGGVVVAPDMDVLVAGLGGGSTAVARYLPDGDLDSSYGDHGVAHLPTVPAVAGESIESVGGINGLVVDGQERALLLWQGANLTRIGAQGAIEPTFGSGGTVDIDQLDQRFQSFHFNALAVLPDDHILVAGIRYGSPQMVVVRLLPSGALDTSFGDRGLALVRFGSADTRSGARRMAVAPDGKIVLAGYAHGSPALARLMPNGVPDPTFGNNGRASAPRWLQGQATALALAPEGSSAAPARGGVPQADCGRCCGSARTEAGTAASRPRPSSARCRRSPGPASFSSRPGGSSSSAAARTPRSAPSTAEAGPGPRSRAYAACRAIAASGSMPP
jgi:uncharacterized delta-60 repeat protein